MIRSKLSSTLFVALFVSSPLALAACGGSNPEPATPAVPAASTPGATAASGTSATATPAGAAATGPVKKAGEAKVGDTTKCPISGEEFVVEATSPKAEHDGKTYFFCCAGCKKKFEADPSKFTKS